MPTAPIPFGVRQESGLSQLGGGAPIMMNVVVDSRGAMRRRPGVRAYSEAPAGVVDAAGISGLYVPASGDLYAFGGNGPAKSIYRVTAGGAGLLGSVAGTGRPVVAETEAMLAIASGAAIKWVRLSDYAVAFLSPDAPQASHVIANNNRLLANSVVQFLNQVFFSDQSAGSSTSGNETWAGGTSGFISADARPDPVVAVGENSNEVFVWGNTNVQVFVQDADLVYASSITREYGCSAPYSIVKLDDGFAWLDQKRRFVVGSGRDVKPVSDAIQSDLDDMDVTGCYGYRVHQGLCDVIVWHLPAMGRTYVYDEKTGWGQWSGWDSATSTYKPFRVLSYFHRADTAASVVGLSDGRVCEMSALALTDLDDPIKASAITGFMDRDSTKIKCTTSVRLMLRRGQTTTSGSPVAFLSWRDGLGDYCTPLEVDLGATGDLETVVQFRSLGTYRSRQWKLEFVGTDDFELVSAEEDYTVQSI